MTPSGGKPVELVFVGSNFSGSTPQTLRLNRFDDTAPGTGGNNYSTGAGIGKLQNGTPTFNESFVFGLQGETPCSSCSGTVSPFGTLSAVGKFTANGSNSITFGEEDVAGVNTTYNLISLSGSYTTPDAFGRGTLTLTPSGTLYPAPPTHFVYYTVSAGELYVMSSDGHASYSLLSGDVLAQTGSFSNSTISGNYVAYEISGSNGDGVSNFPTNLDSIIIYATVQSGNQLAVVIDENNGQGGVKLEQSNGRFTYANGTNGRMTLSGNSPVFYLANRSQLFGTEQPSSTNQGSAGLVTGVQQTSGTFDCNNSGTFAVGTVQAPAETYINSGYVSLPSGAVTLDQSVTGVLNMGVTGTVVCSTDSTTATTGRLAFSSTFGTNEAGYIIVPNSKLVIMSINPGDGTPAVLTIEK
jgi:hypothetical protein